MSADNYMAVKSRNGKWYVWMVLGGYNEEDWEIPDVPQANLGGAVFDNEKDAMKHAYKVCRENVVEYGVVALDYAEEEEEDEDR